MTAAAPACHVTVRRGGGHCVALRRFTRRELPSPEGHTRGGPSHAVLAHPALSFPWWCHGVRRKGAHHAGARGRALWRPARDFSAPRQHLAGRPACQHKDVCAARASGRARARFAASGTATLLTSSAVKERALRLWLPLEEHWRTQVGPTHSARFGTRAHASFAASVSSEDSARGTCKRRGSRLRLALHGPRQFALQP